jgi:hypothetical protein
MTPWARTIGGILEADGFVDFLANYAIRLTLDDPMRGALAILASAAPGQPLPPRDWAELAVREGLIKTLCASGDRETPKGRERGIGVVFTRYRDEIFEARTPTTKLRVRLEGGHRRWSQGKNPSTRYIFRVLEEEVIPTEE